MNINKPIIYLITVGNLTSENFLNQSSQVLQQIEAAIKAGISIIQIREKNLPTKFLFDLATQTVKLNQNYSTKVLINDRADVALATKADGVHLTSTSISTKVIRQVFPKDFVIGVSTHKIEEVVKAKNEGANFAVFSPIYKTLSKEKYGKPQGIEKLAEVVKTVKDFPIIGLGGIKIEYISGISQTGASGIAAISLFENAENLPTIVKEIKRNWIK